MKKLSIVCSVLFFALVVAVRAQERPASAPKPIPTLTPLKVQVVLTRYNGDKKLASMPYTMHVNSSSKGRDWPVQIRMGVQVPVQTQIAKDGVAIPSVNYRNVGTNIDCWALTNEDGRYNLSLNVEQSSVYGDDQKRQSVAPDYPMFRSFSSNINVVLKDGETAQYVTATDPLSGEVLKIDVTLNVIK